MRIVLTQPSRRDGEGRSDLRRMANLLEGFGTGPTDIVVLPELIGADAEPQAYLEDLQSLANACGAWVVGGSHMARGAAGFTNSGAVVDPDGAVVARYGKRNPYGDEASRDVVPGEGPACFEVAGLRCMAMICADFWFPSSFAAEQGRPDVVLVSAFSTSQRPTPHMSRARWRHAAAARAYELGAFIGISDWAHPVAYPHGPSSGVAGFAHPNPRAPAQLYQRLGTREARAFPITRDAQIELRRNRSARGFAPVEG